jgi:hypothetical protein
MKDFIVPRLANCCNGACRISTKLMETMRKEGVKGVLILSPALDIDKPDEHVMANCCNGAVDEPVGLAQK